MSSVITNGSTLSTADAPSIQPVKASPSVLKLAIAALCIALFAGGIGALISAAAFPGQNGKVGATGPVGPKGSAGPAGSAASVAQVNVDTNKLGYCFNTNGGSDINGNYSINSVSLFPPTDSNGALSCPVGQFVSLTPDAPQGGPVSNYNAMVPTGATTSSGTPSSGMSSTATS